MGAIHFDWLSKTCQPLCRNVNVIFANHLNFDKELCLKNLINNLLCIVLFLLLYTVANGPKSPSKDDNNINYKPPSNGDYDGMLKWL